MDTQGIQKQVLSLPCLFGLESRPAEEALPLLTLFNDATASAVKKNHERTATLSCTKTARMPYKGGSS
jgi:hypothetical protein